MSLKHEKLRPHELVEKGKNDKDIFGEIKNTHIQSTGSYEMDE